MNTLELFRKQGYAVVPRVFRPRQCGALIDAAHSLQAAKCGDFRPAMQPHRVHQAFRDALGDPKLVPWMRLLVGGEPRGLQTTFYYAAPGASGFARHQDNYFVEAPQGAFASAWIALGPASRENGCLYGYPGSHLLGGRLTVKPISGARLEGQDPNAANEETVLLGAPPPVDIEVDQGSVVLIHGDFVHGSWPNKSKRWRYALLCTYIRAGEPFRPGKRAQREEVIL